MKRLRLVDLGGDRSRASSERDTPGGSILLGARSTTLMISPLSTPPAEPARLPSSGASSIAITAVIGVA